MVDQSEKNESWDKYKQYLYSNKNVPQPFTKGLDLADGITFCGRHYPILKSFLLEEAINRDLPILFEENGLIRSITSYSVSQHSIEQDNYSAAMDY